MNIKSIILIFALGFIVEGENNFIQVDQNIFWCNQSQPEILIGYARVKIDGSLFHVIKQTLNFPAGGLYPTPIDCIIIKDYDNIESYNYTGGLNNEFFNITTNSPQGKPLSFELFIYTNSLIPTTTTQTTPETLQ